MQRLRSIALLVIGTWMGCGPAPAPSAPAGAATATQPVRSDTTATDHLSYRVIDAANGTFGYEVLRDGQLLIRQTTVPGRPGLAGCRTREQATALATLVLNKIRAGHMPPTVTNEELDQLQIR